MATTSAPSKLQFEGQHADEEVLFTFRRHPVTMRKGFYALFFPFLIASIPVLLWPENIRNLYIAFGGLGFGLILFAYHWMGWYFSVFVVTDQRLRQINQKGFFDKSVIDIGIPKIQNISYNVPGFSAAVLGFGTLVVQTYVGDLYLEKIYHPGKIHNKLQSVIKQHGAEAAQSDSDYETVSE